MEKQISRRAKSLFERVDQATPKFGTKQEALAHHGKILSQLCEEYGKSEQELFAMAENGSLPPEECTDILAFFQRTTVLRK